jgi:hypothetical protein
LVGCTAYRTHVTLAAYYASKSHGVDKAFILVAAVEGRGTASAAVFLLSHYHEELSVRFSCPKNVDQIGYAFCK